MKAFRLMFAAVFTLAALAAYPIPAAASVCYLPPNPDRCALCGWAKCEGRNVCDAEAEVCNEMIDSCRLTCFMEGDHSQPCLDCAVNADNCTGVAIGCYGDTENSYNRCVGSILCTGHASG